MHLPLGEDVLPKSSLLYSKFMLLNKLNNVRIDGKPLETKVKAHLIKAVFKQDHKKMTKNRIEQFLKDNGYIQKLINMRLQVLMEKLK